jgi:predicted transcriptional regulator of viral defense system
MATLAIFRPRRIIKCANLLYVGIYVNMPTYRKSMRKALSKAELVARMVRQSGVFRPRDLDHDGIPRQYLQQAKERGLVRRVGRGLYIAEGGRVTEHHTLAEAAKRVPRGVICLLSALRFHGLTTQAPHEVWMAISHKARRPRADYPPIRVVHFSGEALSYGVEEKKLEGVNVRFFSPAKTVADCFKYRNKIGLDVALEALRDCYRQRKATMDELFRAAKVCRVARVMQPYLESVA